jgi:SAM-dependent methyltransferase
MMIPRIHKRFGFAVVGLDYTQGGCDSARDIAAAHGIPAEIIQADLFLPPEAMVGSFDVVGSYGVVEHFTDTASVLQSCASFLAPGGLMVTSIPCMRSLLGVLLRHTNRPLYDKHLPLNAPLLAEAHRQAGLEVVLSRSLIGVPVVLSRNREGMVRKSLGAFSDLLIGMERRGLRVPANRWTSPYAVCLARKP